ncbi:MAG: lytic transglycosylase domain-containing protein, partial [Gemmatimonadota bacterium]
WVATGLAVALFAAGAQTAATLGYRGPGGDGTAELLAARADSIQELREDLSLYRFQSERLQAILEKSADYRIPADVARNIYDTAREVGLDTEIAFRMVEIESSFRPRAVSSAGAVGFTQIKPSTARWLNPNVSREELFEPRTNLRLGFRYLNTLLDRYDGNVRLALLAYNRGPTRVGSDLAMGRDPSNGYARSILASRER